MTPEYTTALVRGAIAAVIVAGSTFFATAATGDLRVAAFAAGGAFFATLGVRFVGEGTIDSKRANPPIT